MHVCIYIFSIIMYVNDIISSRGVFEPKPFLNTLRVWEIMICNSCIHDDEAI